MNLVDFESMMNALDFEFQDSVARGGKSLLCRSVPLQFCFTFHLVTLSV